MILSDRESRAARARGAIRITPEPAPAAWSSTAVDLTLDGPLSCWEVPKDQAAELLICPHRADYDFAALSRQFGREIPLGEQGHVLEPLSFLLGWTTERIQLPHTARLAARVEGKSSLARLGLGVHVTAPTIHAGFGTTEDPHYSGNSIRLEIWNIGPFRIKLEKGMPICQLIFEWVDGTPEKGYTGQFAVQGPSATVPSPAAAAPPTPRKRNRR
jgi:dCTP deaminase